MKRLLIVVSILCLALIAASGLPPAIPASFYGYATNGQAGQVVTVYIGDVPQRYSGTIFFWEGLPVYTLDVAMDGVAEGTIGIFKVDGIVAGSAPLHSGTNMQVDLVVSIPTPTPTIAPTPTTVPTLIPAPTRTSTNTPRPTPIPRKHKNR
jgi:hypothetical protein